MADEKRCGAETVGGLAGHEYRRFCRVKLKNHAGKLHRDGDFEWGKGVSAKPEPPAEEDIGKGEGCEGGKCEIPVKKSFPTDDPDT